MYFILEVDRKHSYLIKGTTSNPIFILILLYLIDIIGIKKVIQVMIKKKSNFLIINLGKGFKTVIY